MDASKEFIKDAGIMPRISFKESPVHTVILLKDKLETINVDGEDKTGVKFLVQEDGETKSFFTASITLVQKLAEYAPGDEVKIETKSFKSGKEFKTTYDVTLVKKGALKVKEEDDTTPEFLKKEEEPEITPEEQELIEDIEF